MIIIEKSETVLGLFLGNIGNTTIKECINYENLDELEKYILAKLSELETLRLTCLKTFYHTFYKTLFEVCSIDLSSFYFDIRKDILYCNSKDSNEKKVCNNPVLYYLYDYLTTWFAPVLSHTMEECWREFQTEKLKSVHLKLSKKIPENWKNNEIINKWIILKKLKLVNSAIENVRNQKVIGSSLEAEVYLYLEVIKKYSKHSKI